MTASKAPTFLGLTHASSVNAFVMSSEFASATVTQSLMPSKDRAPPNFPVVDQTGPDSVPSLAEGDESRAVVPVASLKPSARTGAAVFGTLLTVTTTFVAVFVLPAASFATAVSVWLAFVAVVEFQVTP